MSDQNSEPIVRIRGLGKSFGDLRVLDGVDLNVHRGTVVSIIGPSVLSVEDGELCHPRSVREAASCGIHAVAVGLNNRMKTIIHTMPQPIHVMLG